MISFEAQPSAPLNTVPGAFRVRLRGTTEGCAGHPARDDALQCKTSPDRLNACCLQLLRPSIHDLCSADYQMKNSKFEELYEPVMDEIKRRSAVADGAFVDRDLFRINIAALWANIVSNPAEGGITELDLQDLHDFLNEKIGGVIGADHDMTDCFRFIVSKDGAEALERAHADEHTKDVLKFFASMILDPEGHKRMMDEIREEQANKPKYPY